MGSGSIPSGDPASAQPVAQSFAAMVSVHLEEYFRAHGGAMPAPGLYERILRIVERPLFERVMGLTSGNQLKAAVLLGIHRNTLRRKLRTLGLAASRPTRRVRPRM